MLLNLIDAGFGASVAGTIISWISTGVTVFTIIAALETLGAGAGLISAVEAALEGGLKEKAIAL